MIITLNATFRAALRSRVLGPAGKPPSSMGNRPSFLSLPDDGSIASPPQQSACVCSAFGQQLSAIAVAGYTVNAGNTSIKTACIGSFHYQVVHLADDPSTEASLASSLAGNMKSFTLTSCYLAASTFMSVSATSKIDVHAHLVPDFYAQALKDAGHTPGPDGMPSIPTWTPQVQLQFMADNNITKSYLSISSPGVYLQTPCKKSTTAAVALARKVNVYGAQLKAQYPDQFGYFASLPLPDVQSSLAEIKYVFSTLKPKPDGVVLMSNAYGMYFGDPALDPVYQALNALNVTIFEHPTTPCSLTTGAVFKIDGSLPQLAQADWWALNRPIAKRQFAAPTLDFPFETARTFADLFVSTVPTRFPNLRWIMPHVGGGLIPTLNRIITYSSLYPDNTLTLASMKATLQKSFYFDLAGPWPVTEAIPPILRWVDYKKILFGSDTPWTPLAAGSASAAAFDSGIDTLYGSSSGNEAFSIRTGNAQQLFGV
ncbi:hypothetical protein G7046_g1764 [Stylonectria norvegica]|nr:hypothetical protein G7046_g1764 [Stylonectria norvegica]